MNKLLSLFHELMQINYLQQYSFEPDYDLARTIIDFQLKPLDKTLQKAPNILSLIPDDIAGKSVLDIGCNKGFFCFEALRRGAEKIIGIDVYLDAIELLQTITEQNSLLSRVQFLHKSFDLSLPKLGRFDIVFFLSAYHYVYANLKSHDLIFSLLAQCCKGQLIIELPLEPDDKFAKVALMAKLENEELRAYNCHAILQAASCHFNIVRYIGNSGFLRTRDIFLLQGPGSGQPLPCEWEGKNEPWSQVRPWSFE